MLVTIALFVAFFLLTLRVVYGKPAQKSAYKHGYEDGYRDAQDPWLS